MKKYLVAFKEPKKQYQIEAQDEDTAKKWADVQMSVFKSKTRFTVTEIVEKPKAKTVKSEKDTGEFVGKVIVKKVSPGSKSERDAVCVQTDTETLVMRRPGANAMKDTELEKLEGKKVRIEGRKAPPNILFCTKITEE